MKIIDEGFSKFVAKKRFGQNFLTDKRVIGRIIDACEFSSEETVLEIGPGQGALTREILPRVKHLEAVETDHKLVTYLNETFVGQNLTVHQGDILKFDFSMLPRPIKVMGNIPYNISTPIIARIIENRQAFSTLFMTVQYEFGLRLVAGCGDEDYSSLSCFVQMFTQPKMLFKISASAFRPMPKIVSCFMRLDVRREPAENILNEDSFICIVRHAFQQRRKKVLNALSTLCPKDQLIGLLGRAGVDPLLRAEDITIAQYAKVANVFYQEANLLS